MVANVILAERPTGLVPKAVAEAAERAAIARWKCHARQAKKTAKAIINAELWQEQIGDVLEFYAAWMPLENDNDYAETRKQLMRLLAGRKALRDFKPHPGHAKIPKSSLDGARESVLIPREQRRRALLDDISLAQRLRLSPGEELDILGLTKRCATKLAFPSVMRVAADPWIRGVKEDKGEALAALEELGTECRNVFYYEDENNPHFTGSGQCYKDTPFPYDGAALFPERVKALLKAPKDRDKTSVDALDWLRPKERKALERIRDESLPRLQKRQENGLGYGEPEPYLAILMADGDYMGKTLSAINSIGRHRDFSRQLAEFAGQAAAAVNAHQGCLIYAGGDDVLAFVPVDRCLACARRLHDKFADLLGGFEDEAGQAPSLSVGIAIGHCIEPLEDLLEYGRQAEKAAKNPDRDGLAVSLHTRGGAPVHVRAQWRENLDKRLGKWADMHHDELISDKTVFDLRQLAADYAAWPKTPDTDEAIKQDIARLFRRKQAGGKPLDSEPFQAQLDACFQAAGHDPQAKYQRDGHPGVLRLANEWIIARKIDRVRRQAQGKGKANP
jgi:CRISPR-associated protein Cmr2